MKKSGYASGVPKRGYFVAPKVVACLFGLVVCGVFSCGVVAAEGEPSTSQEPTRSKSKIFVPSPSASERATPGQLKILEIEFSSKRTDVPLNEDKIRQNMRSSKGGVYSQQVVDGDIESLYKTGDFGNVQIITSEMRGEGGEPGVRLTVLVDPLVKVSTVEVKRKRADGGLDDQLSVDKDDLLDLKLKALTASDAKGAKALADAFKPKETVTKAGDTLSAERLQRDAYAMEDFYRDKGYKDVKITPKTEAVEGGEAKVIFEIDEGIRGFISKVRFIGNEAATSKDLEKVIKLKPRAWWQLFSKSDRFEDLQLKDDVSRIKNYYLNHGYIDVNVQASVDLPRTIKNKTAQEDAQKKDENRKEEDFDPDEVPAEDLVLTYRIEEGRQYRVGTLSVEGNTFFSTDDILNELSTKSKMVEIFDQIELKMIKADGLQEGEVYALNSLQASIETLQDKYGRRGFREVRVQTRITPNVETGRIDVGFSIVEGEKYYVDKIEIQGNTVTKDKVIRREIDLAPGEVFDTVRERSSKRKIEGLNYFSKVETYAEETDVPNRQKLIVKVEEKPTGEVSFGAGFSSVELLTGNITLAEKNFDLGKIFETFPPKGGGQKARMQASIGFRSQNLNLAFTEPWFLDKPIRLDATGFYNGASYLSEFYNQQNYGASIGLSRRLGDDYPLNRWSTGVTYRPEFYNISDVQSDAPPYMAASVGDTFKSSLRGSIIYDGRDSYMLARNGQYFEFGAEGAGGPLLGSENIWKIKAEYRFYYPLWKEKDVIFSARALVGLVDGFSSTQYVPIWDQLFAGGSGSVRGFDPSLGSTVNGGSVGPKQNGQPIGGGTQGVYQAEVTAPFPILENRVRWAVFCDGGFVNENVLDFQPKTYNNTQSMNVNGTPTSYQAVNGGFQIGVGVGIRMDIGIGPMKFDVGFPVMTGDPNNGGGLGAVKLYFDGG
ncbi:MAG: outer membrane protein assembly factor BamA, partial [Verrucomicrobia bacterium]|nr:outer membrane protein assembly factor BamA [Verrucomicrobiota bacterium]